MINLYRVFNPKNGRTPSQNFLVQLNIIHEAINDDKSKNIIIMGDFKLDDSKKISVTYAHLNLFEHLIEKFEPHGLHQLVAFTTWERLVGNVIKHSVLDHINIKDCTLISYLGFIKPNIGDHLLVTFCVNNQPPNDLKINIKKKLAKLF